MAGCVLCVSLSPRALHCTVLSRAEQAASGIRHQADTSHNMQGSTNVAHVAGTSTHLALVTPLSTSPLIITLPSVQQASAQHVSSALSDSHNTQPSSTPPLTMQQATAQHVFNALTVRLIGERICTIIANCHAHGRSSAPWLQQLQHVRALQTHSHIALFYQNKNYRSQMRDQLITLYRKLHIQLRVCNA
jgi:hypothetical protein